MSAQGAETRMRRRRIEPFKDGSAATQTHTHKHSDRGDVKTIQFFFCVCPAVPLFVSTWSGMPGGKVSLYAEGSRETLRY